MSDLGYWLALNRIPGIGSKRFELLLTKFGSARRAFEASRDELHSLKGFNEGTVARFLEARNKINPADEISMLKASGATAITLDSPLYPARLKEICDPPHVLYCLGDPAILSSELAIAIVGSRRCTSAGRFIAANMASELSDAGVVIISGMARGIDTAAHTGALKGDPGLTVAVLGSGIDVIYPRENVELYKRIAKRGAVITEFPPGTQPLAGNFPSRNRIISGLAWGVVIVEAGMKSGAVITVDCALEQGREVMAVPGNPLNPMSIAANKFIKDGAALVENASDVLDNMGKVSPLPIWNPNLFANKSFTPEQRAVIDCLRKEPMLLDDIIYLTKLTPGAAISAVTQLVLDEVIVEVDTRTFAVVRPRSK